MSLHAPLALLLLIPCGVLMLAFGRRLAGRLAAGRRRAAVLALRCGCLLLVILAASDPVWMRSSSRQQVLVVVVDNSASITAAARADEVTWLADALRAAPAGAARSLVVFAGTPRLTTLPARVSAQWLARALDANTDPAATDVEGALRVALGAAPDRAHLLLLTDGLQTTGDARSSLPAAAARRIRIDAVVPEGKYGPDAAMARLATPATVHVGDEVPVQMTVWSSRAGPATISLSEDGRLLGTPSVSLHAGDNVLLVNLSALSAGWHAFHAAVVMHGDTVGQNNALDAATRVLDRPRVLMLRGQVRGDAVAALLGNLGLDVQVASPGLLPVTEAALQAYDAVVLDDLPAPALNARQVAALDQAVRTGGMGLFVVGGAHSLTLGHYSQTGLERLLPLLSDTPKSLQQGNVTLELVLDHSGSMDDLAGDVPKIDMARAAAGIAVDFALQHRDEIGLVSFDIDPHILVPVQKVSPTNVAHVRSVVAGLVADGGTDIFKALRTGLQQVSTGTAPYRHIILMTDGRSEPANYGPLLDRLKGGQATLSTIGLGPDADVTLLKYLAAKGKGRFYYTENAEDLPHIFAEEARLSAGSARVTGTIGVAIGASSPLIRSMGTAPLPPIHGYPATVLKPDAIDDLITQVHGRSPDPVLAHWQYGLGRVAVWTPGLAANWAGSWTQANRPFWNDLVRWLLRGGVQPVLIPQLLSGGPPRSIVVDTLQNAGTVLDLAQLQASLRTPSGARRTVALPQVAPGRYMGALPDAGAGIYLATVQRLNGPSVPAEALLAVPYSQEYLPRPTDRALLAQITAATGGQILRDPRQLGIARSGGDTGDQSLWWPLVVLALVLFLVDVAIRQSDWGVKGSAASALAAPRT